MNMRILLTLMVISYLPSVFFVVFNASSLAPGLVAACLVSILINYKSAYVVRVSRRGLTWATAVFLLLLLQSLYLFVADDAQKPLATAVFLPFVLLAAYLYSRRYDAMKVDELDKTLFVFLLITLSLGWLGYLGVTKVGSYVERSKAIAPFYEESHFALCLGIFSVAYSSICSFKKFVFVVGNLLAFSFFFPSLTLFTFSALALGVGLARLFPGKFAILASVALVLAGSVAGSMLGDFEYFSSRLSFEDSDNLTTLVWLQGWDLARNNFTSAFGTGLGFQMLGSAKTELSEISYRASDIAGGYKNLEDGGFIAAKLIAEFGGLGIALALFYAAYFFRFLIRLSGRRNVVAFGGSAAGGGRNLTLMQEALAYGFVIEFTFRGIGYFSPGVFFLLAAVFSKQGLWRKSDGDAFYTNAKRLIFFGRVRSVK